MQRFFIYLFVWILGIWAMWESPTLRYILGILVAILVFLKVAMMLADYVKYRQTGAHQWRHDILKLEKEVMLRIRQEFKEMGRLGTPDPVIDARVREEVLLFFLEDIPLEQLQDYPGIGEATVASLYERGCEDLSDLVDKLDMARRSGFRRLATVAEAAEMLIDEVRQRMDTPGTTEAMRLEFCLNEQRARMTPEGMRAAVRYDAALQVMAKIKERAALAYECSYLNLTGELWKIETLQPMFQLPLPDLEEEIRQAEAGPHSAIPTPSPEYTPEQTHVALVRVLSSLPAPAPARPMDLFQPTLPSPAPGAGGTPVPTAPAPSSEERRLALLEVTVQIAFAMARTDGRVTKQEKRTIEEHLRSHYGAEPALWNRAKAFCARYESASIDIDRRLKQIAERFSVEDRQELLAFVARVASSSDSPNQKQQKFLEKASRKLGVPLPSATPPAPPPAAPTPVAAPAPAAPPVPTAEQRRAALEIAPDAPLSADLVRRQYNLLTERWSAEKMELYGGDFARLAQEKREAARAAALALLEPFGEPLERPAAPEPSDLRHNPDLDAMFG